MPEEDEIIIDDSRHREIVPRDRVKAIVDEAGELREPTEKAESDEKARRGPGTSGESQGAQSKSS